MNSDFPARLGRAHGIAMIFAGLCALACGLPVRAAAQGEPASAVEAQSPQYREAIDQALSEFKHKNWPEARVLFRRAHDISPSARTLRGIGMVSYEMRDYVQAVTALSLALDDPRQPLTDAQRKECEALLARSRTFVGAYVLTLEPAQADVTLDGAPLVRDHEGRVLVPFGEHTLRASAEGFVDSTSKLTVQGGEQGELRIVLYPPQAAAPAPQKLAVSEFALAAGPAAEQPRHEAPGSERFIGHGVRWSYVALGATAAFGAAAAAVWFTGQKKVNDLDHSCAQKASAGTPCERGMVNTASTDRHAHATSALLGLAGAGLVATAVLLSLEWPTARRSERRFALDVGPQRVSLRGSF